MIEISNNSASIARGCWKKWYWRYVEGLQPIKTSNALSLGKVVHDAFDLYYKGFSDSEIIKYITITMDEQIANTSPSEAEDLVINKYTALGMWMNYPLKNLSDFEQVESEVSFSVPLSRGVSFVGRVDGRVLKNGNWWVREVKTTSQSFSQFERRTQTSSQATGYVWALTKMKYPIQGVIFDYVKKPLLRKNVSEDMHKYGARIVEDYKNRPDMYYKRHYAYRSDVDLRNFEFDMKELVRDIVLKKKRKQFPRNTDQCWNWNSECPYKKICFSERPDPLTIQLYFTTKEQRSEECQKTNQ